MPPPLYDAHQHFQFDELAPHRAAIVPALRAIGLQRAVVNGSCEQDWPVVAALAAEHAWILPSFGLHPWDCGNRSPDWQKNLRRHLDAHPAAPIGEIGLDRWMIDDVQPGDPRLAGLRVAPLEEQIEALIWQLALAAYLNRAASIHCLKAFGPLLHALKKSPRPARGFLLHAYSGPPEMVGEFAALGAYFSFNANFLKRRKNPAAEPAAADSPDKSLALPHLEVWKHIPADRLLVETDAPAMPLPEDWVAHHLPPGPHGEILNHPANLEVAYTALAALRGESVAALAAQVEINFRRLFMKG